MSQKTLKRDRKAVHSATLEAARGMVSDATLEVVNKYRKVASIMSCVAILFGAVIACLIVAMVKR